MTTKIHRWSRFPLRSHQNPSCKQVPPMSLCS